MLRKTFALALGLAALTACSDDDGTNPQTRGRLRVVHAVSDVATTDVLFGTTTVKSALAYKAAHGYDEENTGTVSVKVRKAGATANLVSIDQAVAAAKDYTIIALGTEAAPQSLVLTDDNAAPAAGKGKIRVVHAAIGQGNVDVYVVKVAADIATATAVATNLEPKKAAAYAVVDANTGTETYFVILTTAGTKTPVLSVAGVALAAGKIKTVVAVEKAGGGAPLEGTILADN